MYRYVPVFALLVCATPVYAQSVVCDPTCRDPSTSSAASSTSSSQSAARSQSSSRATGAIAGTQVNAPISSSSTSRGGSASSRAQGGSSNVVVVNRVSSGGGYRGGYSGGSAGTAASDPPAATASDPPALGSAQNPLTENIGGTQTIRNVPEIVAPNIAGGNPCLIGASGGVAVAGVGVTLGGGWTDRGCERRNEAALLANMGDKDVAQELMCDDDHVRAAMARTGHPCAADRPRTASAAQVQVAGAVDAAVIRKEQAAAQPWIPAPGQPVQVAATVAKPVTGPPGSVIPAWCYTSSAAELRAHRECDVR